MGSGLGVPEDTGNSRRLTVLLIGINYSPEMTGIAPYTTSLAEHLAQFGHDVTVFTGVPHYPTWRVFDGYSGRLRLESTERNVRLRRFWHYVPSRQSAIRRLTFEASFLVHVLPFVNSVRPDVVIGV